MGCIWYYLGMQPQDKWFDASQYTFDEAERCLDVGCCNAVANRSYYAVFQYVTGFLILLKYTPPSRGCWPHEVLMRNYRTCICSRFMGRTRSRLVSYFNTLEMLFNLRIRVDYCGEPFLVGDRGKEVIMKAGNMLRYLRRLKEDGSFSS